MNKNNRVKAVELANLPYVVTVSKDKAGDQQIFMAENPELPGCMAQGEKIELAVQELAEARIEYILSLLNDRRDVPLPLSKQTSTSGGIATFDVQIETNIGVQVGFNDRLRQVTAKNDREEVFTTAAAS
mgnify:CR=1 FL=1